ncbi:FAD-dependent oxidoreductase [Candidatus Daviesbacteria bacterium]|nr:FAD-dependent oxidoreductase [Candidatus Daviesbacteria bacterium]
MNPSKVKLIDKEEIAQGTMSFYFEKPQEFDFKAGQYVNLRLINPEETDEEGTRRFFSLASAPFEKDLMIATRMRDTAFKRILGKMPLGREVELFGPSGSLVLPNDSSIPAVFLSGGIGITPFRSMILQSTHDNSAQKIYLFFSNRRPEDSAFLDELISSQNQNPNFKLIATMTQMTESKQAWSGETGFVNKTMLEKYLPNLLEPTYYTAGPPQMVEAMEKLMKESGVPEERIKSENFTGY